MKRINKALLAAIGLICLLLAGCWDINEPQRMLYINGIGVDYKDGEYHVYAQIISFNNVAKSEQPISDQPQAEVGYAKGKTMDEAIYQLYHTVDQKIYWGHFSYIVVSENVMKNEKLSPIIDSFIRYEDIRYQIWVYATKDPVEEVLLVRPVLNKAITLSKLGDPKNAFKQESFIPPMDIRKLIIQMNEPSHEAKIPLISVIENWQSMQESIKVPFLAGVGVVTPNGFKGFLEGKSAHGVQWMSNETIRGEVTFKTDDQKHMTVTIDNLKVKVTPIVERENVKFDVEVRLYAEIGLIAGSVTVEEIEEWLIKEIKREIMATYEAALKKDMDIYRLSEHLYRRNVKAWKRLEKNGKVELTESSIGKLTVEIVRLESSRKSYRQSIDQ
ncbi:Ger(x)C family spore germination protein [Sporosarcina sp. FSL W8-0480]|uniref:Ger(x)C family spore germination protein n=1 Tax=Sporosarcina sp. FSL W8-0480 TaxID=2954701 RepID=UPI0030DBABD9